MSKKIYVFILSSVLLFSIYLTGFGDTIVTKNALSVANSSLNDKISIIIDAGHGGEDGGAVSIDGTVEKDINLAVALILKDLFIQSGFDVIMTRDSDISLHDDSSQSLRDKKVSDIHNRTELVNSSKNNVLISIHQNKFEDSRYYGTQVFFSTNNPLSIKLAESIRLSVTGLLQRDNKRECKEATGSIYLLSKATVPAVIVECGFLSNTQETELLKSDEYQHKMAYVIYCGFLEFYYNNYR